MVGIAVYPIPLPGAKLIDATEVGAKIALITALLGTSTETDGVAVKSLTVPPVSEMLAIGVGSKVVLKVAAPELTVTIGSALKLPKFAGSITTPAIGPAVREAVA